MKYLSRTASSLIALAGAVLALVFWLADAAFEHSLTDPSRSYADCLLNGTPEVFWTRLLVAGLIILLAALATVLLRREENTEAKLRHGHFGLEELAIELNDKNQALERELARSVVLEHQLANLATTDPLTGIHNRRKFDESLHDSLAQEVRYPRGLALIIIDIDHFKAVNDHFGHATGDAVLKELTGLINGSIRESDQFFRIGGEEFAILTYAPEEINLAIAAEKIRHLVERHTFPTIHKLTISLGGALCHQNDSFDSLFKHADDALYRAKAKGRNRVVIA